MTNKINLNLFMLAQEELLGYIMEILAERNIPYEYIDGQIVSLRYKDAPVFVSHMDTVRDADMKKPLVYDKEQNILYRKRGILGADDRAGINLILNHAENINFIFTRDEEIGRLGMKALVQDFGLKTMLDENRITCAIELDRKGTSDILGAKHGYCEIDMERDIQTVLENHKSNIGSYTDIDELTDVMPCANISVGYYNAHNSREYLDLEYFDYIDTKIEDLNLVLSNKNYMLSYFDMPYNNFKFI